MSGERLRIPGDKLCLTAAELVTVAFACAEWDAVYCCEALKPGFINRIQLAKKTAGNIIDDLVTIANAIKERSLKDLLCRVPAPFKCSAPGRNGLPYEMSGAASGRNQRLFMQGKE